jgi:hypothetical protein
MRTRTPADSADGSARADDNRSADGSAQDDGPAEDGHADDLIDEEAIKRFERELDASLEGNEFPAQVLDEDDEDDEEEEKEDDEHEAIGTPGTPRTPEASMPI